MATLDDLNEKSFPPLDVNTPIVDRVGNPTPAFKQQQRSFRKVLIDQSKATNAAIIQEGEVRAEADNASALLVDKVTAEALGFTAAILMKMEVGINPAGVLVRYQIMASLTAGGALVQSGIYFDIVEDVLHPGTYLGQIHLDADKIKLGRADQAGMFPFRIEAGVVYIESAVIKNLSIGTNKVALGAITDLVVAYQGGPVGVDPTIVGTYVPGATGSDDTGVLLQIAGFMDRPASDSGNFGYWQLWLRRNGSLIAASSAMFYDDNFAYPFVMMFSDTAAGANPYYDFVGHGLTGPCNFTLNGATMLASLYKR